MLRAQNSHAPTTSEPNHNNARNVHHPNSWESARDQSVHARAPWQRRRRAATTTARYLLLYILANRLVDFPVLNHDISAPTSGDIRGLEQSGRRKTSSAAHCGRDGETEHTAIKTRTFIPYNNYMIVCLCVCCRHRHVQRDTTQAALEAEKQ